MANAPDFEAKAADVMGLYLNPPAHAACSVSMRRRLPFRPWIDSIRCCRSRPGASSDTDSSTTVTARGRSDAAFNTQTGEVLDKTAARHTSAEFVAFLADIVAHHPAARRSMSSATTSRRTRPKGGEDFLARHPNVHLHIHTPTYSSWLDQVELWFSKRERDMIARRVFWKSCPERSGRKRASTKRKLHLLERSGGSNLGTFSSHFHYPTLYARFSHPGFVRRPSALVSAVSALLHGCMSLGLVFLLLFHDLGWVNRQTRRRVSAVSATHLSSQTCIPGHSRDPYANCVLHSLLPTRLKPSCRFSMSSREYPAPRIAQER